MKIVKIALATLIAGTVITACQTSEKKVETAKENVVEANVELKQAIKDSLRDFKLESEQKFSDYEKSIAELKISIAKEQKADRIRYEKELAVLEQKNKDLKTKLSDFNDDSQEKWSAFKTEFNRDMNDLGNSFKNLVTTKNK